MDQQNKNNQFTQLLKTTFMAPIRTLSEILIEADEANTYQQLSRLSDEIVLTKQFRTTAEISYAIERITELGEIINQKFKVESLLNG